MNVVILTGRLTRDPELRYLPGSGTAVCRFALAIDKNLSRDKKSELVSQGKPTADFVNITTWGKLAENCSNFLKKGLKVAVNGRIQSGSYDKDGVRVYTTDVVAGEVEFLEWANDGNKTQESDQGNYQTYGGFSPTNDDIPF